MLPNYCGKGNTIANVLRAGKSSLRRFLPCQPSLAIGQAFHSTIHNPQCPMQWAAFMVVGKGGTQELGKLAEPVGLKLPSRNLQSRGTRTSPSSHWRTQILGRRMVRVAKGESEENGVLPVR
jgi:hypothetical protein